MILFAAIRPPSGVIRAVTRMQKGVPGARWSAPEKLHVTVGYFGEVSETLAEELDAELARRPLPSMELTLRGMSHFGRAEPHQIHLKVDPDPALTRLHNHCKRVARELRIPMERRDFRPHLTLAYLKPYPDLERIAEYERKHADTMVGPFLVDQFGLYSSWRQTRGPNRYDLEATYPLVGA
ncbi:RNA 2',3'-cyclic phosphodiesterase [uncultured Algimonas sp.]|uniref:RNA 2',3'-cyclic phosphodiesterase n=1 Tax=uncultured Algimonas sp. TaxID=1547920 RepID=UPI00261E5792|nr:RNA 2',3'-cyclic phosphodiesterase [uncultured Algimonas sp.]